MQEVAVAIGLVRRGECYLVGERPAGAPLAGCAEFPGGKLRPGETPEACVVRECLEETGLAVVVAGRRRVVTHDYPHARVTLTFFDCEAPGDAEPRPPFRWVPRRELAALCFPEANREVVAELAR
jgi:mutator protein MutT